MKETVGTIRELRVENFKRIKTVTLQPSAEGLVVIEGRNGAGKSSVLDAIAAALGGLRLAPEAPIRSGSSRSEVSVTIGGYRVTRIWTQSGSRLTVTRDDGMAEKSPQTWLDERIGEISFDPTEFFRAKPAEQAALLQRALGIDTAALDGERADLAEQRRELHRRVRDMEGRLRAAPPRTEAPDEEVSVAKLSLLVEERLAANASHERERARQASVETSLGAATAEVERLERMLQQAREKAQTLGEAVQGFPEVPGDLDVSEVRAQIARAEDTNRKVRANRQRAQLERELREESARAEELTARLERIERRRRDMLAQAPLPVPGLSIDAGGVTIRDGGGTPIPLAQASQAERLKISASVGMALNPNLRVMLLHAGSMLDGDSMAWLAREAHQHGYQVWVERVGMGSAGSVVIEDGRVVGVGEGLPDPGSDNAPAKSGSELPVLAVSIPARFQDDPFSVDGELEAFL